MINENILQKLEEQNKKDPLQVVLRKVLFKSKISDVTRVMEAEANNQFRFSNEIKTLPITNQQQSGRCWIFAGCNFLREFTANKLNLNKFELSQNYVAFYDKLEKINYFMESINDFLASKQDDKTLLHILQTGIQDGGQWQMFVNIVKKYGVVPKEVMPESVSSSSTMYLNHLINIKLRKYACDARELYASGQQNKIAGVRDVTLKELYNLLVATLGLPPKKFNFEYVTKQDEYFCVENLTPKKFYEDYVGVNLDDYVSLINAPTVDKPYYNTFSIEYLGNVVGGDEIIHLNLPMGELRNAVLKQLKDKETVWFGSDVSFDGTRTEGIWDDSQYDFEHTLGLNLELSKAQKLDYRVAQMNHAMTLTGFNEIQGKVNKWKIQNSWGDKQGDKGYYIASDSWFDKYVFQAVVNKKYLTEKQLQALEKKSKKLKPWDPMGSLAD